MVRHTVGDTTYYVSKLLWTHWEKNSLDVLKKTNSDRVYIVDGMERSGKSTWAFQQAGVIDPKMFESPKKFVSRVCFDPNEFFSLIRKVKNGVIVFDEGFRGFSSRAALSKTNKKLVSALMEMGQNNNVVFIVLPRIWLLDTYPALLRSNGLFNIARQKRTNLRLWRGWNYADKNKIYQLGSKKGWGYSVRTIFRDRFFSGFPGGEEFKKAYEAKKAQALKDMDTEEERKSNKEKILEIQRNLLLMKMYSELKSFRKAEKSAKEIGVTVSHAQIQRIYEQYKDKLPEKYRVTQRTVGLDAETVEKFG